MAHHGRLRLILADCLSSLPHGLPLVHSDSTLSAQKRDKPSSDMQFNRKQTAAPTECYATLPASTKQLFRMFRRAKPSDENLADFIKHKAVQMTLCQIVRF
jgi:hypothetical protein